MRVVDIGCGPGIYADAFKAMGAEVMGYDIDPNLPTDGNSHLKRRDIFSPGFVDRTRSDLGFHAIDLVLCLEVAEHVPESKSRQLVNVLTQLGNMIVFSAAIPGQEGGGHINLQPREYWENLFAEHNFIIDPEETQKFVEFMRSGYHLGWLPQNVMIFRPYGDLWFDRIVEEETPQAQRIAEYFMRD